MQTIRNAEWRYATKKFDINKKISSKNIEIIKRVVQLSASSYGLQLYKVLIIEDKNIREQLQAASWNQPQIIEASHLIVFCNYPEAKPEYIDSYIQQMAKVRNLQQEDLKRYSDHLKTAISNKTTTEQFYWTKHQTYIALANLLTVCSELKIDTCPIEGFVDKKYNEILGLTQKGLNASVVAAIGYRSTEDQIQNLPKVRKPLDLLFEEI